MKIKKDRVRFAIIGLGNMGKKYALMISQSIVPSACLTCVCSRSDTSVKWTKENLDSSTIHYRNFEELFEHADSFDAVIITTPHKLHPEIACMAFEHKKHVLCDKPAGVRLSDALLMEQAAKSSATKYGMIFHNRTFPVLVKLKSLLEENRIGEINRILLENTIYYRTRMYHQSGSWRSSWAGEGGGLLINQGQHILDYWIWLFGMPESLIADIKFGKYNEFLVDDESTIIMKYPNQTSGIFILSTGEIQKEERLSIVGSKGKITMQGSTLTLEENEQDAKIYSLTATCSSRDQMNVKSTQIDCGSPSLAYETMIQNFCESIQRDVPFIAEGSSGTDTLHLTCAAYLSAWKDAPIAIPISPAEYDKFLQIQIEAEKSQ